MRMLLLTSVLLLSGCATLIHGSSQSIRVESDPSGAQVEVDGRPVGETPTTIDLKRDQDHRVRLLHADHEPHMVTLQRGRSLWTTVNILNLIVPGVLVDLSTGAFYHLKPDPISPSLEASNSADPNTP